MSNIESTLTVHLTHVQIPYDISSVSTVRVIRWWQSWHIFTYNIYNTSPVSTVCVIGVYTRFQYNSLSMKVITVLLTPFHIQYNTSPVSTVCVIPVYTRFQYNILSRWWQSWHIFTYNIIPVLLAQFVSLESTQNFNTIAYRWRWWHFLIQYNTSPVSTGCDIRVHTIFQYNSLSLGVMTVLLIHFHIQYIIIPVLLAQFVSLESTQDFNTITYHWRWWQSSWYIFTYNIILVLSVRFL